MISETTAHLGVLYVDAFIPAAQSLKNKRAVLKSIKDKVRRHFNVSVAELDGRDKWQRATLGFVMIANDQRYINERLENILSLIGQHHACEISDHVIDFY